MPSPYKLKYRVLRRQYGVVDSVFDDYDLAIRKACDMLAKHKGVELQLVLIGPNALMAAGKHEDSVLFSQTILEMTLFEKSQ